MHRREMSQEGNKPYDALASHASPNMPPIFEPPVVTNPSEEDFQDMGGMEGLGSPPYSPVMRAAYAPSPLPRPVESSASALLPAAQGSGPVQTQRLAIPFGWASKPPSPSRHSKSPGPSLSSTPVQYTDGIINVRAEVAVHAEEGQACDGSLPTGHLPIPVSMGDTLDAAPRNRSHRRLFMPTRSLVPVPLPSDPNVATSSHAKDVSKVDLALPAPHLGRGGRLPPSEPIHHRRALQRINETIMDIPGYKGRKGEQTETSALRSKSQLHLSPDLLSPRSLRYANRDAKRRREEAQQRLLDKASQSQPTSQQSGGPSNYQGITVLKPAQPQHSVTHESDSAHDPDRGVMVNKNVSGRPKSRRHVQAVGVELDIIAKEPPKAPYTRASAKTSPHPRWRWVDPSFDSEAELLLLNRKDRAWLDKVLEARPETLRNVPHSALPEWLFRLAPSRWCPGLGPTIHEHVMESYLNYGYYSDIWLPYLEDQQEKTRQVVAPGRPVLLWWAQQLAKWWRRGDGVGFDFELDLVRLNGGPRASQ